MLRTITDFVSRYAVWFGGSLLASLVRIFHKFLPMMQARSHQTIPHILKQNQLWYGAYGEPGSHRWRLCEITSTSTPDDYRFVRKRRKQICRTPTLVVLPLEMTLASSRRSTSCFRSLLRR